jgi:hypothetical protein
MPVKSREDHEALFKKLKDCDCLLSASQMPEKLIHVEEDYG